MLNPTHIILYDARSPGQNYAEIDDFLSDLPGAVRTLQSNWIVCWPGSTASLRSAVATLFDANDGVMVARVGEVMWYDPQMNAKMLAAGYDVIAA